MKNIENMLLRAEKVELDIVFDSFGNSGTDGIFCGLVCAVHLEFVEYVFLVCYDGVDARIAQGGNFLCRFAFGRGKPIDELSLIMNIDCHGLRAHLSHYGMQCQCCDVLIISYYESYLLAHLQWVIVECVKHSRKISLAGVGE